MTLSWFQGDPKIGRRTEPVEIHSINREKLFGPSLYEADEALKQAVNAALLLDMPLLLTGEPGTGKTQLAEKLAAELGLDLFKFETKSGSGAGELFYTFDHLRRFQAAQPGATEGDLSPLRFIEYGPLGRAILQGLPRDKAASWFYRGQLPIWCRHESPRRAVVLIDEIDKASSDFPNDLLNEIERHYFRVPELDGEALDDGEVRVESRVEADRDFRPIIVITSNSEKQLPDAFLRRCLFHHLQPMDAVKLQRIAVARLESLGSALQDGRLLQDAVRLFFDLRDEPLASAQAGERAALRFDLRKKPSTAEFLGFVGALAQTAAKPGDRLTPALARPLMATLVKSPEDQEAAGQHPLFKTP